MGTITPILDTLLSSVSGRAGDTARVGEKSAQRAIGEIHASTDTEQGAKRNGRAHDELTARSAHRTTEPSRTGKSANTRAIDTRTADTPSARAAGSGSENALSTRLHLSAGARTLIRLIGGDAATGQQKPVTASSPLTAATTLPKVSELANALANQLSGSGLFYEAHLAAWVKGQWPKARLLAEPQARLTGDSGQGAGDTPRSANASANQSAQTNAPIDPRLSSLVSQQADLLASGVFSWSGHAWAGVPMRWSVERIEGDDESANPEAAQPIRTALSLDLPNIGPVEVRLTLRGEAVDVATWAEHSAGRAQLANGLQDLRQRLRQAGFDQASARVVSEEDAA